MVQPQPQLLAQTWYDLSTPPGLFPSAGDVLTQVPYPYRDIDTGVQSVAPVLAICTSLPADPPEPVPATVSFARVYRLDEYVAEDPAIWPYLPSIAECRNLDYFLLPALPSKWDLELLVDLSDQFTVETSKLATGNLCAHLRDGCWQLFMWSLIRRGFPPAVRSVILPSFKTTIVDPSVDGLPRRPTLPGHVFDRHPPYPHEADVKPNRLLGLQLVHLERPDAAWTEWWQARWTEWPMVSGYGTSMSLAEEYLVRAIRRLALSWPDVDPTAKQVLIDFGLVPLV